MNQTGREQTHHYYDNCQPPHSEDPPMSNVDNTDLNTTTEPQQPLEADHQPPASPLETYHGPAAPAIAALRQINQLIGNEETIDANQLGRIRGWTLDCLNQTARNLQDHWDNPDLGLASAFELVLAHHRPNDDSSCLCGWAEWGRSHPLHVLQELQQAGIAIRVEPSPTDRPGPGPLLGLATTRDLFEELFSRMQTSGVFREVYHSGVGIGPAAQIEPTLDLDYSTVTGERGKHLEDNPHVNHAKNELYRAGVEHDVAANLIRCVKEVCSCDHSGGSASIVIPMLFELLHGHALTPLTDDPSEWEDRTEMSGQPWWQNRRDGRAMSHDGGRTFWMIADSGTRNPPDHVESSGRIYYRSLVTTSDTQLPDDAPGADGHP